MGTVVGLRDMHYAILTADVAGGVTYEEPVPIPGAIQANINPNPSIETLFADDGPLEVASTLGQIEVEIVASDLPQEIQAALLGHTLDSKGIMERKSTDVPPWVAFGFRSLKSNGAYRYVWLVKGKFMVPEMNHETKGDAINFQTPTITGQFVKREADDVWMRQADEDDANFDPSIPTGWFSDPDFTPTGGGG